MSTTPTSTSTTALRPKRDHTRWRSHLASALRTALACAMIGCVALFSPPSARRLLSFPAFSYVSALLIAGDATLGDALRGSVHAVYGSVLGLLPALLTLYLMPPDELSVGALAFAVGLTGFVLALPESTSIVSKRVALGQTVLVYATDLNRRREGGAGAVLSPAHVAASTAVGIAAVLLASLFPYPRLACNEARKKSKQYSEMAVERLRLLVDAFLADSSGSAAASFSQAKSLTAASSKLIQSIKAKQAGVRWERPPFKFLPQHCRSVPLNKWQAVEIPLKGMELAVNSISSFPSKILNQELEDHIQRLSGHISHALRQDITTNNITESEMNDKKTLLSLNITNIPSNPQDLPPYFFLLCMKLLLSGPPCMQPTATAREKKVTPTSEHTENSCQESPSASTTTTTTTTTTTKCIKRANWVPILSNERIIVALKCSLSLGLAMLFGLLFSKRGGFWSGLVVAVTMTPWREATFRIANVRAQGTALGSVYGVMASVISHNLMEVRLLALIPWIVFASVLRHSQMYGQAGGIAAMIAAILILGRRDYGSPSAFAITRLTATFIGLLCSIGVELLLQPTRASTLARIQLSSGLRMLNDCVKSLFLRPHASAPSKLKEKAKKMMEQVNQLQKFIAEAELEPNFWMLPFPVECYHKLHSSMYKMAELLLFLGYGIEILVQDSNELGASWTEINETISGDIEQLRKLISFPLRSLEDVMQAKSLSRLSKELQGNKETFTNDPELGKLSNSNGRGALSADEEECETTICSLLQHASVLMESIDDDVGSNCMKSQVGFSLATLGFCFGGMMKEMRNIEKGILELVQWENPGSHIDLYDISCKIKEASVEN